MECSESVRKSPLFHILLLLVSLFLAKGDMKGETSIVDSLGQLVENSSTSEARIDILNRIGNEIRYANPNRARPYIEQALAQPACYPRGKMESWSQMSLICINKPDFDSAEFCLENALALTHEVSREDTALLRVYLAAASLYIRSSQLRKARTYAHKGLDLAMRTGNLRGKAEFYIYLGAIEVQLGKWSDGLTWYRAALPICEEIRWISGLYTCYANIGNMYYQQGLMEKALDLYQKSLAMQEREGLVVNIPATHYNIAFANLKLGNIPEAKEHSLICLRLAKEAGQDRVAASAMDAMSEIYLATHSFKKGLEYAEQGMELNQSIGNSLGIAQSGLSIGWCLYGMGNYKEARPFAERTYQWCLGTEKNDMKMHSSELLSKIYEKLGKHQLALQHFHEFMRIDDSLVNVESIRRSSEQIAQLEYEKRKEMEDLEQKQEDEMKAAALKRSLLIRNILLWGCLGLFLIVMAGARAYFRIRHINRKLASQAKEISYLNDNLEQLVQSRTEELHLRNRQLADYIFTNSHRVRGPIARILGLLQLKQEGHFPSEGETEEVFQYIHVAAKEADQVIFEIGNKLEGSPQ